ncbi:pyruvate, phosphate dikinase [Actinokineospora enzanensis]|uniref:pyruvate, phosphate dikinase n=1 Tax=Actinokineospora enzanensis TaxID=155975 RepID=UPI00035F7F62|nr:pyruvate, phosphate dikinase [Actinokineospora enzanensis]
MRWIRPLSGDTDEPVEILGAKAQGLLVLRRLGLPVPSGFVITTDACREFLRAGRFPEGLADELVGAMAWLAAGTGRRFGGARDPLLVSVRSGASVSMPGMMDTILNLGLTSEAAAGFAAEDSRFAADLLSSAAELPDDANAQLTSAVETVFESWNSSRARTYRELNDIPHDLGTAVIVQAMVFGNRDEHSGTGVAFSRDPDTGENVPYGDVLFGHQGEDVVSGRTATHPLCELASREPTVWTGLVSALATVESHYRDACYVEFTFQSGELWLLQVRPGRFVGGAAVRVAVELADAEVITREEALLRVSPQHLSQVRTPHMTSADVIARGIGAGPGVTVGRIATTTEAAVRLSADGPVILVRPETSPHDMRGLAAATGIITARGGPASHAAVVARSMGKPAVVGVAELVVDSGSVRFGAQVIEAGSVVTIDGTSGEVARGAARATTNSTDAHLHRLLAWADDVTGDHSDREESRRLIAAQAALRLR